MRNLPWALLFLFPVFSTAQDLCAKACVIHAECGIGGECAQGTCRYQSSYCGNERWAVNARGETSNCEAYRCSPATGLCLRQAESTLDCLTGYVFDGLKSCVPSIQCNLTEPHCQDFNERWKKARAEYEATTPEPQQTPLSCISCKADSECSSNQMCWNSKCSDKKNYCFQNDQGSHFQFDVGQNEITDCGSYACEKVISECLKSCYKNSDCRTGRSCFAGNCL